MVGRRHRLSKAESLGWLVQIEVFLVCETASDCDAAWRNERLPSPVSAWPWHLALAVLP